MDSCEFEGMTYFQKIQAFENKSKTNISLLTSGVCQYFTELPTTSNEEVKTVIK